MTFDEKAFLEVVQEALIRIWYPPQPDYTIGIFDGKLGHVDSLDGWEVWGLSTSGLPVFKSKK